MLLLGCAAPALGGSIQIPLTLTDTRAVEGGTSVETDEWKIVFSDRFNGDIHQRYDLSADPNETNNLTTASSGGFREPARLPREDRLNGLDALLCAPSAYD